MARILIAEDEEGLREYLADALEGDGHETVAVPDGVSALERLHAQAFDLLLTDLRMPGAIDGIDLLRTTKAEQPELEVVVLTAHGTVESAVEAMRLGAFDYLQKPVSSPAELRLLVARALERRRLVSRVAAETLADDFLPPLTYGDPAMAPVERAVEKVAPTNATVLLLGESGTGKEVVARTIHRHSRRADGPFVAVNCAAISETLMESELFGHEKGAFTGATASRRGRLELAEGGTMFLDEIGELKPELQAKLLRVLQERRFERVGGTRTVSADVRWIAATNRDLTAATRDGAFREDLYHRLAVFPVHLPPLRERTEDIAPLAGALLARIARDLGKPGLRLGDDVPAILAAARWPGNVRELANALERAAILADDTLIRAEDLDDGSDEAAAGLPVPGGTLEDLERAAILRALAAVDGNRRRAAERLGIGLRTLYDKLKRYGMSGDR